MAYSMPILPLESNDAPTRNAGGTQTGRTAGLIDKVRLSSIARTQNEIRDLMTKGLAAVLAVDAEGKLTTAWGALKSATLDCSQNTHPI